MTQTGIVHLGLGAFFRAFGVPWIAEAMAAKGGDWAVTGVSLRAPSVRDQLAAQEFAYHTLERGAQGVVARRITALKGVLVAPEDPQKLVDAMADPTVSIVSLTITEKGYCYSPAKDGLDLSSPGIVHELANPELPETAPGFIVAALAQRRARGLRPFTCLSCDNLPENGHILRRVVLDLARRVDPMLAGWIAAEGRFPCTMVDRIVPATTQADIDEVERLTGIRDAGAVMHEPFRQWVIEDDFVDGARPEFEAVGVQMVTDVAPFEHMKLRCLNGTHSALAYLGTLAGYRTVVEAIGDGHVAGFIKALWHDEIIPSFDAPPGVDVADYVTQLLARYENPAIQHHLLQIAMDGSQKLPQRILATIADNLAAGRSVDRLALVVAGWMHFLRDGTWEINDPLAGNLQTTARAVDPVAEMLKLDAIFAPGLTTDPLFRAAICNAYQKFLDRPVTAVLKEMST